MAHEGGGESRCIATLLEGQHDELEAAMYPFKNLLAVFEAEQAGDLVLVEQQVAQALGAQVGVNTGGNDDAAVAAFAQQVGALFGEQLVEVDVAAGFFATHDGRLALELGGCAIPGRNMRETG